VPINPISKIIFPIFSTDQKFITYFLVYLPYRAINDFSLYFPAQLSKNEKHIYIRASCKPPYSCCLKTELMFLAIFTGPSKSRIIFPSFFPSFFFICREILKRIEFMKITLRKWLMDKLRENIGDNIHNEQGAMQGFGA
jgi:hypothetical protein